MPEPELGDTAPLGSDRPLVTFLLVTYQQERFVREAVEAALAQDYEPLEIVISDDCSADRTFQITQEALTGYVGGHRVTSLQTPRNLGLVGNLNWAMTQVSGELIVVAAGDDISLSGRTRRLCDEYLASGREAKSIYSDAVVINENGDSEGRRLPPGLPTRIELKDFACRDGSVLGCTHAWVRELFDVFGPLDEAVMREDAIIPFRATLLGHISYLDVPLVLYRRHGENMQFGDPSLVRGRTKLYASLRPYSSGNVAVVQARLHDLRELRATGRQCPGLEAAEATTRRLHVEKKLEHLLIHGSRFQQFTVIVRGLLQRVPIRRLCRWFLLAFLPRLYLRHQRRLCSSVAEMRLWPLP